jgi:hypothetical protein
MWAPSFWSWRLPSKLVWLSPRQRSGTMALPNNQKDWNVSQTPGLSVCVSSPESTFPCFPILPDPYTHTFSPPLPCLLNHPPSLRGIFYSWLHSPGGSSKGLDGEAVYSNIGNGSQYKKKKTLNEFHRKTQNPFKAWTWARHQWLLFTVLASLKAKIRRTVVQDQPRQISLWDSPISKTTTEKWAWGAGRGGVTRVVGRLLSK